MISKTPQFREKGGKLVVGLANPRLTRVACKLSSAFNQRQYVDGFVGPKILRNKSKMQITVWMMFSTMTVIGSAMASKASYRVTMVV